MNAVPSVQDVIYPQAVDDETVIAIVQAAQSAATRMLNLVPLSGTVETEADRRVLQDSSSDLAAALHGVLHMLAEPDEETGQLLAALDRWF
jgi:hypothetical protein